MLTKAVKFKVVVTTMRMKAPHDMKPYIPDWNDKEWNLIEQVTLLFEQTVKCLKV
jgi:hypothetical protein